MEPDGLREFVVATSPALLRTAYLLTGDLAAAEDVLQSALVKTWRNWSKVAKAGQPEMYVRRILTNEFLGSRRRRWTGESPSSSLGDTAFEDVRLRGVEDRSVLSAALMALSPGQRAVVVLRYFDDLSEQQTADLLGTSTGTVKSQTSRALARLRVQLAEPLKESS